MRLLIKNLMCWLGFGHWLIEYCHDCGRKQPIIWWAGAALWYDIVEDSSVVLCPQCFDKRAQRKGYLIQWTPGALRHYVQMPSIEGTQNGKNT